jgi:dihydrofolate reductase
LIVAIDRNRAIGHQGKLLWHLPADLQRFKSLTMGHHIIMGRKTWESIGRLLPGRTSVVVTRNGGYAAPGALLAPSLLEALALAQHDPEPFVIGGAEIFREALPLSNRVYLTEVFGEYAGDVWFPPLPEAQWRRIRSEEHPPTAQQPGWRFSVYERRDATMDS